MADRAWKTRPAPKPTSLTEIARRYHATALALAQSFGVPCSEAFVREHHAAIASCFIEAGKAEVRLPASVILPPLGAVVAPAIVEPPASAHAAPEVTAPEVMPAPMSLPTSIPDGLPLKGVGIDRLTPAQLYMLLAKVDQLCAMKGKAYQPLLEALTHERHRRVAAGAKTEGNGHGA